MSHIFISYSRNDIDFAGRIVNALAENKLDTWIDWKSIPKGEDWEQEIYRGIEEADAFLFLISLDSVKSEMCNKEIAHAVKNGKRILPIFISSADVSEVNKGFREAKSREEMSRRNYLFCRDGLDDFTKAIEEIRNTIHTDYEWLKYHTKLQVKALDWERRKDDSRLLRGKELQEAEQQLASAGSKKDPQPTDLQRQFVSNSRRAEQNRQKTITRIAVSTLIIFCLLCITAIAGGGIAYIKNQTAATAQVEVTEQKKIADTRQLATIANNLSLDDGHTAILSGLLAVEAARRYPELASDQAMYRFLSMAALPIASEKFNDSVTSVNFSSDGKLAVAASLDGTIRIWDAETGNKLTKLNLNLISFYSQAKFSPDRNRLAATDCVKYETTAKGYPNCTQVVVRVFDTTNWQEISRITYEYSIQSFAFSPDSTRIVTGGNDGVVRIWDVTSGKEIAHTSKSDYGINTVEFSPDGNLVVSDFSSKLAVVWNSNTGQEISQIEYGDEVTDVTFSPKGNWVASSSYDGTVKIWATSTGSLITNITLDKSAAFSISFSSDGKWLVSNDNDDTIRVWDISTGQELLKITGNSGSTSVSFSPDNKWIISASDNMAHVWDVASGHEIARMYNDARVGFIAFSPDGKKVITGSDDGTARVWDINTYQDISHMEYKQGVSSVAFSPDGKWVVSGSWDGTTTVWDSHNGQEISHISVDGLVQSVAFSADGKWIAQAACEGRSENIVACGKPVIRIWEANTGQEIYQVQPEFGVVAVKFMPDGKRIIIADDHAQIQLLDLKTGNVIATFHPDLTGAEKHGRAGISTGPIDVDPLGRWVAAGGVNSVQVWDLNSTQQIYRIPRDDFSSVAFSWDGKWLVSASSDIRILNAETGEEVQRIQIDPTIGNVSSMVYSPDGNWLAGVTGAMIRIWKISTGNELVQINSTQAIYSIAFSPDGEWITSGGYDNIARVSFWKIDDIITEVCKRLPRNLTLEEWKQYFGDEPYRPTCSNLPIPTK
jgi:WD40 repeat protein